MDGANATNDLATTLMASAMAANTGLLAAVSHFQPCVISGILIVSVLWIERDTKVLAMVTLLRGGASRAPRSRFAAGQLVLYNVMLENVMCCRETEAIPSRSRISFPKVS